MNIEIIVILIELCCFLLIRIIIHKRQILRKGHVALFYSALIGFFYFLPFAFLYGDATFWSHLVWGNFLFCLYAIVGSVSYGVNPMFPKGAVRTPMAQQIVGKEKNGKLKLDYEEQGMDSSLKIMNHALTVIPKDIHVIKNVILKNGKNTVTFFNILISPQAIYHLYPCNWGGPITFTNTGAKKTQESEFDTQNYAIKTAYAKEFISVLLSSLKIDNLKIMPIIVTTNQTSEIKGNPTLYKVVHVSALESFLRGSGKPIYTPMEQEEIKQALNEAAKK